MTSQEIFGKLLKVRSPWKVADVELEEEAEKVEAALEYRGKTGKCPECGKRCPVYDRAPKREWRHLDACGYEMIVSCAVPRVKCPEHGTVTMNVPWAEPYNRFTKSFEAHCATVIANAQSLNAACRQLQINWRQAAKIMEKAVEKGMEARDPNQPIERLGIDEKSFRKGHDYISTMFDLDASRVLEVVEGRSEDSAIALFEALSEVQRNAVEAIAMDMWQAYIKAAFMRLPAADIVHDKFHVVSHLNKAMDNERRAVQGRASKQQVKDLKGSRYLFLKNLESMSDSQLDRFDAAMAASKVLAKVWHYKDAIMEFYQLLTKEEAHGFLKRWFYRVIRTQFKHLKKAAHMLMAHMEGVLNYFQHWITNAKAEGINSKIQAIKSAARGFRTFKYYRIAILFHCGGLNLTRFAH